MNLLTILDHISGVGIFLCSMVAYEYDLPVGYLVSLICILSVFVDYKG